MLYLDFEPSPQLEKEDGGFGQRIRQMHEQTNIQTDKHTNIHGINTEYV
jgi:hypothetical protein